MYRSISLCVEPHAECLGGKFVRGKFLVCVTYERFVIFLYVTHKLYVNS